MKNITFFIDPSPASKLSDYVKREYKTLVEKYKRINSHFVCYSIFQDENKDSAKGLLPATRYHMPCLSKKEEQNIIKFYQSFNPESFLLEQLQELLLEAGWSNSNRPVIINIHPSKFFVSYYLIKDIIDEYDLHFEQHIINTLGFRPFYDNDSVSYSGVIINYKTKENYDADLKFEIDSKEIAPEIQKEIDSFKSNEYGAFVEATLFMLQKLRKEQPELIRKLRPFLENTPLLNDQQQLSPVIVNEHYKVILPDFGNQEVVMHPLPRAVYILFLRYPEGIRFKELYQHREELLDIYNKITNQYDNDKIIQAIDDLVDMTKPSINQKCARIREAFRRIMDEPIARHYYIDGPNGEPKKIGLPERLVDIRY